MAFLLNFVSILLMFCGLYLREVYFWERVNLVCIRYSKVGSYKMFLIPLWVTMRVASENYPKRYYVNNVWASLLVVGDESAWPCSQWYALEFSCWNDSPTEIDMSLGPGAAMHSAAMVESQKSWSSHTSSPSTVLSVLGGRGYHPKSWSNGHK